MMMGLFTRYTEEEKAAIEKAREIASLEARQQELKAKADEIRAEQRSTGLRLEKLRG